MVPARGLDYTALDTPALSSSIPLTSPPHSSIRSLTRHPSLTLPLLSPSHHNASVSPHLCPALALPSPSLSLRQPRQSPSLISLYPPVRLTFITVSHFNGASVGTSRLNS
ncbi:hypothetical protein E2C01_079995 [Portunus trituberculatus]|uniref:Uncharacterized protein n=1 Tax=Portunus trituberculatus TaxID=210409 RepID=A0A5B7IIC1_PORTR|nr:hypothetical protein [Portunus trituberculatus]